MSGFDAMIAAHMRGIVTSPLHRGEPVTYVFQAGGTRAVNAMVMRPPMQAAAPGARRVGKIRLVVILANHATEGVTTVADGDAVRLPVERGGAVVECRIREVLLNEGGAIHLEVQSP